jgi:hypothetical protein
MTNRRPAITGAHREDGSELAEGFATWMTEATVPEGGDGGGEQGVSSSRKVQWIKRPGDISPDDQFPGQEILHRTTRGVKLHRAIVIGSELTNRNKILNKLG